jgi:hypothetical protein
MLEVNKYSKQFIDECRSKVNLQLSTYKKLISTATDHAGENEKSLDSAIGSFERVFFNNMVLVLDAFFVHRIRAIEGKDGNPLNEVRVICNSIMNNKNIISVDNTIRLNPDKSILKYKVGDEIKLNEVQFEELSGAFFTEIEKKYL